MIRNHSTATITVHIFTITVIEFRTRLGKMSEFRPTCDAGKSEFRSTDITGVSKLCLKVLCIIERMEKKKIKVLSVSAHAIICACLFRILL